MIKMIVFDMDGTLADLYAVPDWLPKLRASDPSPYAEAIPMWNMEKLAEICHLLQTSGIEINVVTWLSLGADEAYKKATAAVKREWLERYGIYPDHFHAVQYGATKADSVRRYLGNGEAILIDDNEKVRKGWHLGAAVNPQEVDILAMLEQLAAGN